MTLQSLPSILQPWFSATPPASPVDGQEWIFPADSNGTLWRFRYNAGSGSAWKWEFCGGFPLSSFAGSTGALSWSGASANDGTLTGWLTADNLPLITLPRAGEYLAHISVAVGSTNGSPATRNIFSTLFKQEGGAGAFTWVNGGAGANYSQSGTVQWLGAGVSNDFIFSTAAAGSVVKLAYGADAALAAANAVAVSSRILTILPRRVS